MRPLIFSEIRACSLLSLLVNPALLYLYYFSIPRAASGIKYHYIILNDLNKRLSFASHFVRAIVRVGSLKQFKYNDNTKACVELFFNYSTTTCVFICVFILLSRESDQSAITSSLRSCLPHVYHTKIGGHVKCFSERHKK